VFVQFAQCYAMMPIIALVLARAFRLPTDLTAGMVLVGSINGGQATNLCTYIAKGNVAHSVIMTTAPTLGTVVMTPLLCKWILGTVVPIDAMGIAISTVQVVLGPIAAGMITNRYFPGFVKKVLPIAPVLGVLSTIFLVGAAVGQVSAPIMAAGLPLQAAVLALHIFGGLAGYFVSDIGGFPEVTSRTMAIETAMKSSAFGFLLAKLHFGNHC